MKNIKINKQQAVTSIFILFCLAGYVFFPANGYFQYKFVALIFLVALPFLYNNLFLKKENILIGDWKKNLLYLMIGLFCSFLIMAILFKYTDIGNHYLLSILVKTDFKQFLLYEFTGVAFTVTMYELFFRGFVMFYFSTFLGKWAIVIQFLFFIVLMLFLNLPYWFYVTYLVFNPFAGWIAYKSNSLSYSFFGQLFFIIIIDSTFIALTVK